ncbi:exo-1,3-beta-glucanase [Agyrium rufum]|nr:exo-1,3-beta-glucanase [Agyrium rufum]
MRTSTILSLVAASSSLVNSLAIKKRGVSFDFGSELVQGVNIGGWLVLEPWITPSIFQAQDGSVVDEWTLCANVDNAADILKSHWDSWAALADFQRIKNSGFNTVRIPIGYWAFKKADNEPYIQGAQDYLDKAIGWAGQVGLKVWIDVHGAPGSQNGFDNSGHRIQTPTWESGDTVQQTIDVLQMIADKYAQASYQDTVVAVELLNEPLASELASIETLTQFYENGYDIVRDISDTNVMIHDAFQAGGYWNDILQAPTYSNVVVDHHEYQVFTDDLVALQPWQHRQLVCNNAASYAGNSDHWLVVGEWTAAMTDCAPALNGYLVGARYDGTYPGSSYVGSCAGLEDPSTWSDTFKSDMRGYVEAQLEVYEQYTRGWVFWNFKTETAGEWDLFRLIDAGVFPQPLSDRKFSSICSF